jgi:hypothetical protein
LPAVKQVWAALAAQADKEGWPAAHRGSGSSPPGRGHGAATGY